MKHVLDGEEVFLVSLLVGNFTAPPAWSAKYIHVLIVGFGLRCNYYMYIHSRLVGRVTRGHRWSLKSQMLYLHTCTLLLFY